MTLKNCSSLFVIASLAVSASSVLASYGSIQEESYMLGQKFKETVRQGNVQVERDKGEKKPDNISEVKPMPEGGISLEKEHDENTDHNKKQDAQND